MAAVGSSFLWGVVRSKRDGVGNGLTVVTQNVHLQMSRKRFIFVLVQGPQYVNDFALECALLFELQACSRDLRDLSARLGQHELVQRGRLWLAGLELVPNHQLQALDLGIAEFHGYPVDRRGSIGRPGLRSGGSLPARVRFRAAKAQRERQRVAELYQSELQHYRQDEPAAVQIATDPLGPLPAARNAAELAAWTVVANMLLNMDAVLTKG